MTRILLVSPAPEDSRKGNGVTARRWRDQLRLLGYTVEIAGEFRDQPCDVLLALHARRSAPSVQRFHRRHPDRPLLLALTGTDLFGDLEHDLDAQRSLPLATALISLQDRLPASFPDALRARVHVIHQSTTVPPDAPGPSDEHFQVCVLGHLREVKDPLRTAEAVRELPATSRIQVIQAGAALEPGLAERAAAETRTNPRYRYLGELPREEGLRWLASSHLHVLSSRIENGANALIEAIALGVPTLWTRIPGNLGIVGDEDLGGFAVGDTPALRALLLRAESDGSFLETLRARTAELQPLFTPEKERQQWRTLMERVSTRRERS